MKNLYCIVLLFLIGVNTSFAQLDASTGTWAPIGDVILSTVTDDADNGDGLGDGALLVDGQSNSGIQGAIFTFGGNMPEEGELNISIYTYNRNSSFVRFRIQLYNATTSTILVTSSDIFHNGNDTTPINTVLSHTATIDDEAGQLEVRFIRIADAGNTYNIARDFAIDNITLVGPCPFLVTPDLALIPSSPAIETQITNTVTKFSDSYLGTNPPSAGAVSSAESSYAALNIVVSGGSITGNPVTSFSGLGFLKTFAQHLKFNPGDINIKTKANNTVWWFSKQFCSGNIPVDTQLYSYENFARPAVLLNDFLSPNVKSLFEYTLYKHSVEFEHFWQPVYNEAYQQNNGTIVTDVIYNIGDVLLAYSLWQDTPDERYRYMRAYKRYMDRFFSYTVGTTDGIKADGTGFHHWVAYNNYMYAYNTAASLINYLSETAFQVEQSNYQVFRNAFYTQYIQANDAGVQALSTAGRNPQTRTRPFGQSALKNIAIAGGKILGLSTADPVFAGMYNRIHGVDAAFNYNSDAPFETGFFQFNHAMAGAFRKDNWLVFNKGFSNNMWGTETYIPQNRYGRYQSYGAQEVIYPGNKETGNGYDDTTWDWNYNPGATVIVLPWEKLHAERGRLDEEQQKRFVGALNLKNKNSVVLTNNHGEFGMFAMDFQQKTAQGFGVVHGPEQHNSTFTFKKSNFYFDDIIVCLGSGINNNDTANPTVTTLFQRLDNKGGGIHVNGTNQTSTGLVTYGGTSNNWLLSNYGTGFYIISGSGDLVVKKELQQNPNQNQIWPVDYSGNPKKTYYTGYINHGTNPSNKNYEYILKPNSNTTEMQALAVAIQGANKPYTVHKRDANAHIVEHISKKIWGYAFFNAASNLSYDYVKGVNASCLVMTQYNDNNSLLVSIVNPDIGFNSKSYAPSIQVTRQVTLQGEWDLSGSYSGVQIVSANAIETVIEFTLVDGLAKEVLLNSATLGNQKFEKSPVAIYPNPTNSILNIDISDASIQIKNVSLIDISGKIIFNQKNAKAIHVNGFAKGLYFVNIETNTGRVLNKKIIIN